MISHRADLSSDSGYFSRRYALTRPGFIGRDGLGRFYAISRQDMANFTLSYSILSFDALTHHRACLAITPSFQISGAAADG